MAALTVSICIGKICAPPAKLSSGFTVWMRGANHRTTPSENSPPWHGPKLSHAWPTLMCQTKCSTKRNVSSATRSLPISRSTWWPSTAGTVGISLTGLRRELISQPPKENKGRCDHSLWRPKKRKYETDHLRSDRRYREPTPRASHESGSLCYRRRSKSKETTQRAAWLTRRHGGHGESRSESD